VPGAPHQRSPNTGLISHWILPTPQVMGKNHINKDCMVFLFVRVYWRQYQNNATVEGVHPPIPNKKV